MYKLFDYQSDALDKITDYYDHGGRATVLQLPTGTGKSLVASTFISRMKEQSKPVYFVTSSSALLWQFSEHLEEFGLRHGIIKAGCPTLRYRVQIISVQSLMNRIHMIDEPWGLIFEECHHSSANQFKAVLDKWPNAKLLGLTATPSRPDGQPLSMYDNLITAPPVRWFIDNYYLSDFDYFIPAEFDTTGIHHLAGEFKSSELEARLRQDKTRIGNMVKYYERYAAGLPGIAFGTSIADSEYIADSFREAGYKMQPVHSKLDGDVQAIFKAAKSGALPLISSCDLVGEGISINGLQVELDGRPTESLIVNLQHHGRVLRAVYAPGYDLSTLSGRRAAMEAGGKGRAKILDFSSNYLRHGLPDDDRVWTLSGSPKIKQESQYKRCPSCQRPIARFLAVCNYCGYEFPRPAVPEPRETKEREGEMIQLTRDQHNDLVIRIAREAHDLKSAIAVAKRVGVPHSTAWYIWKKILKKA